MTTGPYGRFAAWILHHRALTAALLVVLSVAGVLLARNLKVDANVLSLLPEHDPWAQSFFDLYDAEGGGSQLTITLTSEDPAALDAATADLVKGLGEMAEARYVLHEIDPQLAYHLGLVQLEAADVNELTVRLKGALALGPALNPIVTQRLMDMGPVASRIQGAFDLPWLQEKQGRSQILVRPTGAAHDRDFSAKLMAKVDALVEATPLEERGVRLAWVGGAYRHNVEDVKAVSRDVVRTSLAATGLILLILALGFRSWRAVIILFIPLLSANAINLGLTWLAVGTVNTYTSFGTAILMGLGIDFAIHLMSRYREERARGLSLEEALIHAWDKAGPPNTTAALTSAAGFLALSVADYRGFSQLGALLASGLILSLVVTLTALPLLIPWLDAGPAKAILGARANLTHRSRSTYRLAPLGLMVAVLLTGLASSRLGLIGWEFDMSELRTEGMAYAELSEEERAMVATSYAPVVVSYASHEALVADTARVRTAMADGRLPHIGHALSIENLLPSDQSARVAALVELKRLMDHPSLRYLPAPLVKSLLPLRGWQPTELRREDLPESLLDMVLSTDPSTHRLMLLPQGNLWDLREAQALQRELRGVIPERPIAGAFTAQGSLYAVVTRDMPRVSLLAFVLVTVLALIDLRRANAAGVAVGALVAGMVWAGAALQIFGIKLSIVNVVGIPILLGIGIDVIIHLLHRLREEGPGGVRRVFATTGIAATLSVVTTVASFAALSLATSRGVQSLGFVVTIGLSTVFLVAVGLVPLAWSAGWRWHGKAPGDPRNGGKHVDPS